MACFPFRHVPRSSTEMVNFTAANTAVELTVFENPEESIDYLMDADVRCAAAPLALTRHRGLLSRSS